MAASMSLDFLRTSRGAQSASRSPSRMAPRILRSGSEEHTSELQSLRHLVCRLLLEKKRHGEQPSEGCPLQRLAELRWIALPEDHRYHSTARRLCRGPDLGEVFFFLRIRRPPSSTLFPHTTPSR